MVADVATIRPNLNAVLELRNAVGELLAMASPFDTQPAEIVRNLLPGGYFLSVMKSAPTAG